MTLVLAAGVCLASGFALLALCQFPRRSVGDDICLRVSLSVGYGLGIFSVVFYLSRFWPVRNLLVVDVAVLAVLITARAVQLRLRPGQPSGFQIRPLASIGNDDLKNDEPWPDWFVRILTIAFGIALVVAVYSAIIRVRAFPHGDGWDAFTIWNLHARFLFLGGDHWRDGFTPTVGGSHPDYPLLLPAAIAHFWTFLGSDDPHVPALIGVLFAFATVGVLFAALSTLRGRVQAMMGATALLTTPFFIEQGTVQYADIPLSFFFLATVVLLCLFDGESDARHGPGLLVLAGLAAGFAAWTKNEGLLFVCAIAAARLLILLRAPKEDSGTSHMRLARMDTATLLFALAPGLLLVIFCKHSIAVPGDLFSDPASALPRLLDPARYWAIFAGYAKGFFRFGHWLWIPGTVVLVVLMICLGWDLKRIRQSAFRTSVLALGLTLVGYFAVFLITPYDIHWHLRFSLLRLFLQVWPSAIFLFFLGMREPSASRKSAI
jgi:dolichyl-phosphate-mannose-protein mannosyltransferase